jgi:hypothetical protein
MIDGDRGRPGGCPISRDALFIIIDGENVGPRVLFCCAGYLGKMYIGGWDIRCQAILMVVRGNTSSINLLVRQWLKVP